LACTSHVTAGRYESFGGPETSKLDESFDQTLRSLMDFLRSCATGVALFDRKLRCRVSSGALGRSIGISVEKQIGKRLRELFPGGASQLDVALKRVWTTGESLLGLELTASLAAGADRRRWLVSFYPISDEAGQVRLVAGTFLEITKERCVEMKIGRLKDKFQSEARRQPDLLEGEFSEMSARTFEVVNRSLMLLKSSVLLRFYASQKRLESWLMQRALFLKANPERESLQEFEPTVAEADHDEQASAAPATSDLAACSPREREVLQLLAEGKSNKEIGLILELSTRTVEAYRARIMIKLNLHSTAALVRYAIRNNIVEA
jgi:DNA-binding CsgD family transcriptional regulator